MSLAGRRIVLGVSGGIAAYKSALLVRLLTAEGAQVKAVMTASAQQFIGPATLAGLTGNPVTTSLVGDPVSVSPHTELASWADLVVIAPATAATLGRIAHSISEDALSATVLATKAPVVVAPAMHTEMWEHPAMQRTMNLLTGDGVIVVGPEEGDLAGGAVGVGRMSEPSQILAALAAMLDGSLAGKKVLVTAGGTREPIDPVRFIGNRSSGLMGHAIAIEAARRGADVTLVTSSHLGTPPSLTRVQVETAAEMADAVDRIQPDVAVMAAAVADFRPAASEPSKLSRSEGVPQIILERTPDILASVAQRPDRPFLVGFAAETGSLDRALNKARTKGVDLLVANDITEAGAGFEVATNRVTIVSPDGSLDPWPLMSKEDVARRLWDRIETAL